MKKINFKDLPLAETPINSNNLNLLQDNIEKSCVIVSPTEPTTNEKVWIQHSKNLFNKDNYNLDYQGYVAFNLKLELGKTYTLSSNKPLYVAKFSNTADQNNDNVGPQKWGEFTSWTFIAGDNVNNFLNNQVFLGVVSGKLSTNINDFDDYNIQIEEGSTATEYEKYIEKKIYVNGEKFLDVEKTNAQQHYSTAEQVIGTWIDGKTLYRKVVKYSNTETIGATNTTTTVNIPHNISNIGLVVDHKLIMDKVDNMQYMFPYYDGDTTVKKGTVILEIHNTTVLMRIINDTWGAGKTFYIVLDYTKTTD